MRGRSRPELGVGETVEACWETTAGARLVRAVLAKRHAIGGVSREGYRPLALRIDVVDRVGSHGIV